MNRSESIANLATALAKANLELSNPTFDKKNNHYNNGYASLAAVLNAIRKPLATHGLSLIQTISTEPSSVTITTSLIHASGEWLSADVSVSVPNNATAQAVGGATTYMRRYSALSMCGIAGDDDDAEEDRRDREERKPLATPTRRTTREAPKAPAQPAAPAPEAKPTFDGKMDRFPDEGEVTITVKRVVERGKAFAVHAMSAEHGGAWLRVQQPEMAECLRQMVNGVARVTIARIDVSTIDILAVKASAAMAAAETETEQDANVPF